MGQHARWLLSVSRPSRGMAKNGSTPAGVWNTAFQATVDEVDALEQLNEAQQVADGASTHGADAGETRDNWTAAQLSVMTLAAYERLSSLCQNFLHTATLFVCSHRILWRREAW